MPGSQGRIETVESLHALKRRVYLGALAAGVVGLVIGWYFKIQVGSATAYDRVIFPFMTLFCLGLFIRLWRTAQALPWFELLLFAGTAMSLLGRLAEVLFGPANPLDPLHSEAFSDLLYWFPLVYVLAFLVFAYGRRLIGGALGFFAAIVILGLTHSILSWQTRGEASDFYVLGRFYAANVVYIILLVASSTLNERYLRVRAQNEAMTLLANTDPLVRIANRREINATITREIHQAARRGQPLALILYDLDHFKHINDRYGHAAGDSALIATAGAVQALLRASDVLGRWGGDEFVVILPQTDGGQARLIAERLRQAIAGVPLANSGPVTARLGVTEYRPPEPVEAWFKRVDAATYAAKQAGRNRVVPG